MVASLSSVTWCFLELAMTGVKPPAHLALCGKEKDITGGEYNIDSSHLPLRFSWDLNLAKR